MAALDNLDEVIERCQRALDEFVKGNPEPMKAIFSHREDATLANPFGPPARGWKQVAATLDRAASNLRDGAMVAFEEVRDPRARLHRVAREAGGQACRQGGHNPIYPAGYDGLSTRRRHLEGSAPTRGPHNHPPAGRVGDPGVDLPLERTSDLFNSGREPGGLQPLSF
jgi:hypothetical protein